MFCVLEVLLLIGLVFPATVALSGTLKASKHQRDSKGRLIYGRCFSFRYNLCKGERSERRRSDTLFGLPKNCERKREIEGEDRPFYRTLTHTQMVMALPRNCITGFPVVN